MPTYKEQGFDELVVREWFGFFMPAGASQAIKDRASTLLRAALIQPDVIAAMQPLAAHVEPTTIAEHQQRLKDDSVLAGKWCSHWALKRILEDANNFKCQQP